MNLYPGLPPQPKSSGIWCVTIDSIGRIAPKWSRLFARKYKEARFTCYVWDRLAPDSEIYEIESAI